MTIQPNNYGIVHTKTKREVILLNTVGGCSWGRCSFCEYKDTFSRNAQAAVINNRHVLEQLTGIYGVVQVICSASFVELPMSTWYDLRETCQRLGIHTLIIEMHWIWRNEQQRILEFFNDFTIRPVYGLETFNFVRRETEWFKGYGPVSIVDLKKYAFGINLLIGVKGQTMADIEEDVLMAKQYFGLVNVLVFEPNDTAVERDWDLCETFYNSDLFLKMKDDPQFEILDGLDRRAPDNLGFVGEGAKYR